MTVIKCDRVPYSPTLAAGPNQFPQRPTVQSLTPRQFSRSNEECGQYQEFLGCLTLAQGPGTGTPRHPTRVHSGPTGHSRSAVSLRPKCVKVARATRDTTRYADSNFGISISCDPKWEKPTKNGLKSFRRKILHKRGGGRGRVRTSLTGIRFHCAQDRLFAVRWITSNRRPANRRRSLVLRMTKTAPLAPAEGSVSGP